MSFLSQLRPGTRFRIPSLGYRGRLVLVNKCRARVWIEGGTQEVNFVDKQGRRHRFTAKGGFYGDWTPATEVVIIAAAKEEVEELETKTEEPKAAVAAVKEEPQIRGLMMTLKELKTVETALQYFLDASDDSNAESDKRLMATNDEEIRNLRDRVRETIKKAEG